MHIILRIAGIYRWYDVNVPLTHLRSLQERKKRLVNSPGGCALNANAFRYCSLKMRTCVYVIERRPEC